MWILHIRSALNYLKGPDKVDIILSVFCNKRFVRHFTSRIPDIVSVQNESQFSWGSRRKLHLSLMLSWNLNVRMYEASFPWALETRKPRQESIRWNKVETKQKLAPELLHRSPLSRRENTKLNIDQKKETLSAISRRFSTISAS